MRRIFPVFMIAVLFGCEATVPKTFNATYLPEFVEYSPKEKTMMGREFPMEMIDEWVAKHGKEKKSEDEDDFSKKKTKEPWSLFWLNDSEIIIARSWWEQGGFKPSFSDFMIFNLGTGETLIPDENRTESLLERLENIVERRDTDTASDTAKTVVLTFLSVAAGTGTHNFDSFEGEIRNLNSGTELAYEIKIYNEGSDVTFITDEGDKYQHMIHVPKSEMFLSPDGNYVFFPYGYMVNATKPNRGFYLWYGYSELITSTMHPGWKRVAMLEKNEEGKHILRIARFVMPEEEI